MTEIKRELLAKQKYLLKELIDKSNINIVTCGNCGEPLLHELKMEEIKCLHCEYMSDSCDFPDLFY